MTKKMSRKRYSVISIFDAVVTKTNGFYFYTIYINILIELYLGYL